ncbi:MAG: hypothetical protein HC927_01280 [Deltaproteobacteria bacterium]|nr:hypothetical protein [Deltaproteobacteria bacterium]
MARNTLRRAAPDVGPSSYGEQMASKKLVYPGMPQQDQESWIASQRAAFKYPITVKGEYQFKKKDTEEIRLKKEKRREKFRATREKEWEDKLFEMDAVKAVGGVVFEKGKTVEIDSRDRQIDHPKLASLVESGILVEVAEGPASKPKRTGKGRVAEDGDDSNTKKPKRTGKGRPEGKAALADAEETATGAA